MTSVYRMPRSFLVKKSLKGEDAAYHSYRVRDIYDDNDHHVDISLKAIAPFTPISPSVQPLTVTVNNGKYGMCTYSGYLREGWDVLGVRCGDSLLMMYTGGDTYISAVTFLPLCFLFLS